MCVPEGAGRCADLECGICWAEVHHYCSPHVELTCSTCGAEWVAVPIAESAIYQTAEPAVREAMDFIGVAYERVMPGLAAAP